MKINNKPPQKPTSPDQRMIRVRDRDLVLVLDNCEHMVEACASLARTLLERTARLRILATSRQELAIPQEQVFPVPPLPVPPHGEPFATKLMLEYAALELFVDRARTACPDFSMTSENQDAVVALCRQLDGLPLAIEIAAARTRTFGVQQMVERLDRRYRLLVADQEDGLAHHRTMRAAVDWSYDLCTTQEQVLWRRSSVFAGDFDLDAVEEVCAGAGLDRGQVLEAIIGLADKSLLVREGDSVRARFRMLESIRQYGLDRLRECGNGEEEAVRRRLRDWCSTLVADYERRWFGRDQVRLVQRLSVELDNIRTALEFCLNTPGERQAGLGLAGNLWFFWFACGRWMEGQFWLQRLLSPAAEQTSARAKALWVLGLVICIQGDADQGLRLGRESHELSRQLGNDVEARHSFLSRGGGYLLRGEFSEAQALYEEELSRPPLDGEHLSLVGFKYIELAFVLTNQGEPQRAIDLCQEFRQVCQTQGEQWVHSYLLRVLALAEWEKGDYRAAQSHAHECLRLKRAVGDVLGIAMTLELLAAVDLQDGQAQRAAVLLGASGRVWQDTGSALSRSDSHGPIRRQAENHAHRRLGSTAFHRAYDQGLGLAWESAVSFALGESTGVDGSSRAQRLSPREMEVAGLIAEGLSNQEIAGRLVISRRTAEGHVDHILRKLGFRSRSQIAVWVEGRRDGAQDSDALVRHIR